MLDDPEMVSAFAGQLRRVLAEQADFVARVRRDAEAMWRANPPEGYSSFEAWWQHRRVTSPFGQIQAHIEKAAKLTFALEARYRRRRHEIPARRQAAAQAGQAPALPTGTAGRPAQPRQRGPRPADPPDGDFLDLVRGDRRQGRSA
jgi:hypothetical protein